MHTSGPWKVVFRAKKEGHPAQPEVLDGDNYIIAGEIGSSDFGRQQLPNAFLLAASLDLLKELEESTVCLEFVLRGEVIPAALINQIDRNHDLINKVKGE